MLQEWINEAVWCVLNMVFSVLWWAFVILLVAATAFKFYIKSNTKMCRSLTDMTGKTVIVTGANTGIGKETARDLAQRNARVILACRNEEAGRVAAKEITEATGNGNIEVKRLDLTLFRSIRDFAEDVMKNESRLDVLINNAGIQAPMERKLTSAGYELTFATNHLGGFLLTNLLLDLLKKSAPSRVVTVASLGHRFARHFDLDNLQLENFYNSFEAYGQSKLANILFTIELARRLEGTGVTASSVHPGFVNSDFVRQGNPFIIFIYKLFVAYLAKTPFEGAQTTIYAAVAEELEKVSGKYYSECAEADTSKKAKNMNLAKDLWEISEKLTGLKEQ